MIILLTNLVRNLGELLLIHLGMHHLRSSASLT